LQEINSDKVAIYIRWSTEDQGEGTTLDVQLDGCKHYLQSQGWHFHDDLVFVDDGYSGGSMDRPALDRLRKLVQKRRVECVVCYKLDRLSRSVVDTVNLVLEEWDDLCHVKSAREAIDTTTHAGKMFFYTLVSYAEWERSLIRERTASGRVRRAQEGRWAAGKPPYGYVSGQDKRLALNPEEAPVVERIFREYQSGKGSHTIAHDLNQDGILYRGKVWRTGAVKRLLNNPVYCGDLIFGVTRVNPKWKKRPGEGRNIKADEPYVKLEGAVPAIVSREDWAAVQAHKRERHPDTSQHKGRAYSSPFLLSALAKCAKCGYSLIGMRKNRASDFSMYFCRGHRDYGTAMCDAGMIRTDQLDNEVIGQMKRLYGSSLAKEKFVSDLVREVQVELEKVRHAKVGLEKGTAKLQAEQRHVRKLLRANEISSQEYREMVADVEGELKSTQQQLADLVAQEDGLLARLGTQNRLSEMIDSVDSFDELTTEQKKHLLGQLIKSLRVFKPKRRSELQVEIEWAVPVERPAEYVEHLAD
jgi:site-specific DNA recombinase